MNIIDIINLEEEYKSLGHKISMTRKIPRIQLETRDFIDMYICIKRKIELSFILKKKKIIGKASLNEWTKALKSRLIPIPG